jgi:hypothetical protein
MGTGYFNKDSMLSPSELEEKGIKAKKNHVYFEDNNGKIRTFKYSSKQDWSDKRDEYSDVKRVSSSTLEKIANSTGLTISTIKNNIGSMIRHFKQGTKGIERKNRGGVIKKAKGGIVQKFSKGGTVERPRGVGIAKRGYGQVIR